MRSEEIRKALRLDVREVPRVLKEGLAKKKLKSKGQKRATTYTAAQIRCYGVMRVSHRSLLDSDLRECDLGEVRPAAMWEAEYVSRGRSVAWGYDQPEALLFSMLAAHRPAMSARGPRMLDLGCGNGRNALPLRQRGYRVVGLDVSPTALVHLRERSQDIPTVLGDVTAMTLEPGSFDIVVDAGCLHAIAPEARPKYVAGVLAVLRPGGAYFLCARSRHPESASEKPVFVVEGRLPEWGFTREDLYDLFGPTLPMRECITREGRGDERFLHAAFYV